MKSLKQIIRFLSW